MPQHNQRTNTSVKRTVSHGSGAKLQGGKRDWAFRPRKFKCYTIDAVVYTETLVSSTHRHPGAA